MSTEKKMRRQARNGGSQAETLQRWGMMLGGGALTVFALTRRKPGIALAAAGGLLAYRGATIGTT